MAEHTMQFYVGQLLPARFQAYSGPVQRVVTEFHTYFACKALKKPFQEIKYKGEKGKTGDKT